MQAFSPPLSFDDYPILEPATEDVVLSIEIPILQVEEDSVEEEPYWKRELRNEKMRPATKLFCVTTFQYMDVVARSSSSYGLLPLSSYSSSASADQRMETFWCAPCPPRSTFSLLTMTITIQSGFPAQKST